VTAGPVVIGVGNPYRGDDGIGPAVIDRLERLRPAGVRLVCCDGEPAGLIDAWTGAGVAVIVDAVLCEPSEPGRVHRSELDQLAASGRPHQAGSHSLGVPDAVRLARALDRMPDRLVVYAVEAAELGFGTELSGPVTAALPRVLDAVLAELAAPG
jgi:hydrogenase maturation protease